jgi:hypothetical protein
VCEGKLGVYTTIRYLCYKTSRLKEEEKKKKKKKKKEEEEEEEEEEEVLSLIK